MYKLFVIGSGGTGSYFLKEFSRYYQGKGSNDSFFSEMFIFDGDTVEEKNLLRQSFLEEDIGFNKSAVLAGMLNDAFDLKWRSFGKYITSADDILSLCDKNDIPVIIGCVDNHACRLVLEEVVSKLDSCYYMDSANEFSSGEVVFVKKDRGRFYGELRSRSLKMDDVDLRAVTEMSCEELNNAAPQHIATNMMAGNILLSGMCNLIEGTYKAGKVFFNSAQYDSCFCEYVPKEESDDAA